MTAETTEPTVATALTGWRTAQQQATNATWHVSGIPAVAPFCITQNDIVGEHTGSVHYLLLTPLLEIAKAFDATVTEATSASGTTYSVVVLVDGINVTIWSVNPADAPVSGESA